MAEPKKLFLTYSWRDNQSDVEFIAQQLERAGVKVMMDKFDLTAGQRLWTQIAERIRAADAWAIFLTANSIQSEPCMEELSFAHDQALKRPGFPVIGLWHDIDEQQVPAALKIRLGVPMTDQDWIERIVAAVDKREPRVGRSPIDPVEVRVHASTDGSKVIEFRPRVGTISPVLVAVPVAEANKVQYSRTGPANQLDVMSVAIAVTEGEAPVTDGANVSYRQEEGPVSPTRSLFLTVSMLPSVVYFGHPDNLRKFDPVARTWN